MRKPLLIFIFYFFTLTCYILATVTSTFPIPGINRKPSILSPVHPQHHQSAWLCSSSYWPGIIIITMSKSDFEDYISERIGNVSYWDILCIQQKKLDDLNAMYRCCRKYVCPQNKGQTQVSLISHHPGFSLAAACSKSCLTQIPSSAAPICLVHPVWPGPTADAA